MSTTDAYLSLMLRATGHLESALVQVIPTDDQIIVEHLREALRLLREYRAAQQAAAPVVARDLPSDRDLEITQSQRAILLAREPRQ